MSQNPVFGTDVPAFFAGWTGEVKVVPVGAHSADVRVLSQVEPDEATGWVTVAWFPEIEFAEACARVLRAAWGARATYPKGKG